jgi:hypothetical protein
MCCVAAPSTWPDRRLFCRPAIHSSGVPRPLRPLELSARSARLKCFPPLLLVSGYLSMVEGRESPRHRRPAAAVAAVMEGQATTLSRCRPMAEGPSSARFRAPSSVQPLPGLPRQWPLPAFPARALASHTSTYAGRTDPCGSTNGCRAAPGHSVRRGKHFAPAQILRPSLRRTARRAISRPSESIRLLPS